ncbi:MAG TPA: multicopper oxidase domain-containing protein [Streptosporangiaceae bacterium]|nr:multicopper oxidase domain-containing protein [Streptosporangiaceae bacterium]
MVPPPSVPLSFLTAAAFGLVACGIALIWARGIATADPTADPVVAAAHFGMLATLSMGVAGALHQFTPVVTQRPLRSVPLAWATFAAWLGGAWLIPSGIAAQREGMVEAGGGLAAVAVTLLTVNLTAPLSARGKGHTVTGLRFALAGFVATACFGVSYVADRHGNWFDLSGHVVLAHAVIGLFAWLGLTYVAVAEKLWPMFFLAHVPGRHRAGRLAVWLIPAGVTLLSPGLLASVKPLAWAGAVILAAGLAAHLASLAAHVRHRRRKGGLHLAFVATAAGFLIAGAGLALAAALVMPGDHHAGMALAAAAVAAFAGWLLEALAGHVHKVVPFILWSVLRGRGLAAGPSGRPLGFGDLYDHRIAAGSYALVTAGITAVCAGFAATWPAALAAGGGLLAAAGLAMAANLSIPPALLTRKAPRPPAPAGKGRGRTREAAPSGQQGERPAAGAAAPPPSAERAAGPALGGAHGSVTLSAAAIAVAAVAVLMAAAALWPGRAGQAPAPAAAVAANGQVRTFSVELGDMFVRPSSVSVPYGTTVVLHVVNHGVMSHDLQLEGGSTGTGMLSRGQSRTVSYGVFGQTGQVWCTVPGHKAAGMILTVKVTGTALGTSAAAPDAVPPAKPAGSAAPDAVIDPGAAPPPGWHAVSPVLAPAPSGTVHHVTLAAEDREMQVAPGVTQDMWTFNGQVPGPVLRGHVGDTFVVTLVNRTGMSHSIDFHAAGQPMQAMTEVAPGRSVTYEFKARYAGIYLYHCGTPPVLQHLTNGMFGAVIIDPPHLPAVSREFLIVQSELYLGPQRQSGDYAKMLRGQPDGAVFNSYYDQYRYAPLHVTAGQRVRLWVLDAGPSHDSSFHVVGAQFTTVFNNGAYLLQPGNPADGAAQTIGLMPGEGGFAEFTVPAAGRYALLDHHLNRAAAGAAGYIDAGVPGR